MLLALSTLLAGCASQGTSPRLHPQATPTAPKAQTPLTPEISDALPPLSPVTQKTALVQHPMLTQVQMVGPYGGWAIEQLLHGMAVARTEDGGRHWTTLYVTPHPAIQLSAADMQTAYVLLSACSGSNCSATQLMATHDGGATWQSVYAAQGFEAKAVSFVSPSVGYVAGTVPASAGAPRGDLLATQDAGQVWTEHPLPCDSTSMALSFPTAAQGWLLCGGPSGPGVQGKALFHTLDGGANWSLVSSVSLPQSPPSGPIVPGIGVPLTGFVHTLFFRSAQQGWMGLDRGGIYETTDGGVHWHPVWQPPFAPGADDAFSVGFTDALHGWVLYGEGPPLSTTSDGGRTWTIVYPPLSPATSISFSSTQDALAAGWVYDGTLILSTTDGGVQWTMAARAPVDISSLTVVGPSTFLVLGQNALYRTEDGGATWAASPPPQGYYPASIGMLNADVGYLAAYKPGAGRALFSTTDGGELWQPLPTPFSPAAVAVSGNGSVLAVGPASQHGIWQHVFNGTMQEIGLSPGVPYLWRLSGGHWWPVRIPGWHRGQAPLTGLRVGQSGLVWMWSQTQLWLSTNGGASWQEMRFGDRLSISDVSFTDPLHGWILSAGNNVYATSDGGQTWREIAGSPTY